MYYRNCFDGRIYFKYFITDFILLCMDDLMSKADDLTF